MTLNFCNAQSNGIPQLRKRGKATSRFTDDKPFIIVDGELNNSTSSGIIYMKPIWQFPNM